MFDFLQKKGVRTELTETLVELADMVREISDVINHGSGQKVGSFNASGEEQVAMDVQSQEIFEAHMKTCPFVARVASEELDGFVEAQANGIYTVVTDPLDGSSLMDVNFSVGTIVGIYESTDVLGLTGRDQVAALCAIYGPHTSIMMTTGKGVYEFALRHGEWKLSDEDVKLSFHGKKYFAPGNLRATAERKDYLELVNDYMLKQYTLRYSGGMVPDVLHALKKGHGIFMYPGMPSAPDGKLRILFECAPMSMIVENAGGAASDGAVDILDIEIKAIHQRTPIYIGTPEEVGHCKAVLKR